MRLYYINKHDSIYNFLLLYDGRNFVFFFLKGNAREKSTFRYEKLLDILNALTMVSEVVIYLKLTHYLIAVCNLLAFIVVFKTQIEEKQQQQQQKKHQ
jgi:hypothetical protein